MRGRAALLAAALALAGGSAACRGEKSGGALKGPATTAPTGTTSEPSTTAATGPVTDADVTEVDQVLHRLDTELDRLDSDLTTGEGEVQ